MPRGDKSSYTNKQKRMAEHIEEGYEDRGTPRKEAARQLGCAETTISVRLSSLWAMSSGHKKLFHAPMNEIKQNAPTD